MGRLDQVPDGPAVEHHRERPTWTAVAEGQAERAQREPDDGGDGGIPGPAAQQTDDARDRGHGQEGHDEPAARLDGCREGAQASRDHGDARDPDGNGSCLARWHDHG
ncbi:hypothetical protein GALL_454460 [mine drainage metagenome]|uniref:Uncharacterized protein n=1 Tax=mine drainage metagenome TaxID=410659 RepID=A0A1J5PN36_9ZZZZ